MEIQPIALNGLQGLAITTAAFRMVVITEIGPRIAWFSKPGGANLLYWDPDAVTRGAWKLYGGHRVWLTRPLADESEDTYLPDNDPCAVTYHRDGVDIAAPASPTNRIARGMEIRLLNEAQVRVRNTLHNEGTLLYAAGVWSPTCVVADKPIRIPLGCPEREPTWDVVYMAIPRVFAGNVTSLGDGSAVFSGDTLLLTPQGRCVKRCVRAEKGEIRLCCEGFDFVKRVTFHPDARYPLNGCNLAAFIGADNWMAEMETFGGERAIKPGETIGHDEIWSLEDH